MSILKVLVAMGSQSDWEGGMSDCVAMLEQLGISHEVRILSAHRTPRRMFLHAEAAEANDIKAIIAGAGMSAHLAGMIAALAPTVPVFGVPMESAALKGMDSLLSMVQMPKGVPVGVLAIGKHGAVNAAILAAQVIGLLDPAVKERLRQYREGLTSSVTEHPVRKEV